jgi:phenylpyruvate tautomerase PptA (4-oxalocrotonate tautomerase family)
LLGEKLTAAVLEVETGKDTAESRPGVMVQFEELPESSWFHGGKAAEDLYEKHGIFGVTAIVMQGPWTSALKAELSSRLAAALRDVARVPEKHAIWITVHEVPDGAWSVNGRTVRIERLIWAFESDRQANIRALLASTDGAG